MKRLLLVLLMTVISPNSNRLMAQWTQTNGPLGSSIQCFASIGSHLFAGTEGGVYRSEDNGTSWTLVNDVICNSNILALSVMGTELFAGTDGAGVFRSSNYGTTWTSANSALPSPLSISSLAVLDTALFAGTFCWSTGVYRSSDHGYSWIPAGLATYEIKSLAIIDTVLFAQTAEKGVFRSTDHGASWISVTDELPTSAVISLDAIDTALYAGTTVGLYCSTDYGNNWTALDSSLTNGWKYTLASIESTLFVGTGDVIYSTSDGSIWTAITTGLPHTCLYANGTYLFAGTVMGVYRSADYGVSWTDINTGITGMKVHALAGHGANLYAGTWGGVFRSGDRGNTWTPITTGSAFLSLAFSGSDLYAGGMNHVTCFTGDGSSWEGIHVAPGQINALAICGTNIFAGLGGLLEGSGVFRITHDAPGFWTITQTTLKNTNVNSLAVKDTNIYAGTEEGVFRSTNNGVDWTAINNGLTSLEVSALAVSGSNLFAGTRGGGVFLSANEGASWTSVNNGLKELALDVLSFVFSGDNLFIGTNRGGVFLSTDYGASWTAVNTGSMSSDVEPASVVQALAIMGSELYAGTRGAGVWRRPLSELITSIGSLSSEPSITFSLEQNFPNPFNPVTVIEFTLSEPANATLKIFNLKGEQVAVLLEKQLSDGTHRVNWDASGLASGVYLYRLETEEFMLSKKLILMR